MIRILGAAAALPPHRATQAQVVRAYRGIFKGRGELRRYLPVFARSGVGERRFVRPLAAYGRPSAFAERNAIFLAEGPRLGRRALAKALRLAGGGGAQLRHLISATTTGLATPSLEALVAEDMGLPADMSRTPLFGTGCASGAVALSRAYEAARSGGGLCAAMAVELCSLTLRHDDASVANLVGCALFGDGAAAAVVGETGSRVPAWSGAPAPAVLGRRSHLFPNSRGVMGWDFQDGGMRLVLTPEVPALVRERLKPVALAFLREHGVSPRELRHWILHPGGLKVIEAYEAAFGIGPAETRWARRCLARVGNLSSASVLFMLADLQVSGRPRSGDLGLVAALGPGFAAELLLLRW